jgi:hypothetical protein
MDGTLAERLKNTNADPTAPLAVYDPDATTLVKGETTPLMCDEQRRLLTANGSSNTPPLAESLIPFLKIVSVTDADPFHLGTVSAATSPGGWIITALAAGVRFGDGTPTTVEAGAIRGVQLEVDVERYIPSATLDNHYVQCESGMGPVGLRVYGEVRS